MKKLLALLLLLPALAFGATTNLRVNGTFSYVPQPASGSIMRSNGTSWVGSTATYPNTVTANNLLYGSSSNVVGVASFLAYTGATLQLGADNPGADMAMGVSHSGTSSGASRAVLYASQGGAGGGDAVMQWILTGLQTWTAGADISASNNWVLSASTALGTSNVVSCTTAGDCTLPGSLAVTGTITPGQTTGIVGTTTNNDAQAGSVGEFIEAVLNEASKVSLTSGATADVVSITLTPGDWDVGGLIGFGGNVLTVVQYAIGSISLTTGTLGTQNNSRVSAQYTTAGQLIFQQGEMAMAIQRVRVKVATATTQVVYLTTNAGFTTSTAGAFGSITARRMR